MDKFAVEQRNRKRSEVRQERLLRKR